MHNHDHRQLSSYWDEHGCLIIKARLTAEQGAVVMKAMDVAMETLRAAEPSTDSASVAIENESGPDQHHQEVNSEKFKRENQQATRRRADSLVAMAEAFLRDTKVASTTDDRYQVIINVDSNVLAKKVFEKPDGTPDCYIDGQVALPVETARRLSCSCKVVTALTQGGEPLSVGRSTRAISLPIKRALKLRDGHCVFPGCDCHKNLDAHHIVHWANGGETSLENELRHQPAMPDETAAASDLPNTDAEPWSWCGDTMDYTSALFALSSVTRNAIRSGALQLPDVNNN